ncbi:MAG TPA: hypothetical protein VIM14_13240 [Polyangia bacterium]
MNPLEILSSTNASRAGYAFRAWLIAVVPSLLCFFALVAIGAYSLRPPAGALGTTFAGYSILAAPVLETALMFPVASLLTLLIPRHRRVQIVVLAMICALAHKFGGGWRQVFASLWPFLIYSVTLTTWLKRSPRDAFLLTALVHALYNATFFSVGALGAIMAGAME